GLTATATSTTRIDLAWTDASTTETGFRVERRLAGGGAFASVGTVGANVTAYADATVTAATSYEYRVFAFDVAGDSPAGNVASATTPALGHLAFSVPPATSDANPGVSREGLIR